MTSGDIRRILHPVSPTFFKAVLSCMVLERRYATLNRNILKIENVTLHRGGRPVLQDISLHINSGDRIVIRGDNGSGKTTLLKAILGLLPLISGTILLKGNLVGSREWKPTRQSAAWVPQEGVLHRFPVSAREVAEVGLAGCNMSRRDRLLRVEKALEQAGAGHLSGRCFHRLSGGERQRISIARCLAQEADLLLLDEPSAALDAESRERLVKLTDSLADSGITLIIVTHENQLFSRGPWKEFRLEGGNLC
jgi:ABC-type Mn2+/Zn2+ transport system ATPase subunit